MGRSEFGEEWEAEAPVDLVMAVMHREAKMRTEQLVILSHILSHDSTIGYDEMENILLVSFNETKVENLQHLLDLTYRNIQSPHPSRPTCACLGWSGAVVLRHRQHPQLKSPDSAKLSHLECTMMETISQGCKEK